MNIEKLREIASKASSVVMWYAHPYDTSTGGEATIRGPWNRWFTVSKAGHGHPATVAEANCDAEFAAAAMNNLVPLLDALTLEKQKVETLKAAVEFYADKENWNKSEPHGRDHVIKEDDLSQDDCLRWIRFWGGKRARSALKSLKEMETNSGEKA